MSYFIVYFQYLMAVLQNRVIRKFVSFHQGMTEHFENYLTVINTSVNRYSMHRNLYLYLKFFKIFELLVPESAIYYHFSVLSYKMAGVVKTAPPLLLSPKNNMIIQNASSYFLSSYV